ncbi:MAG: alanine racemase [Dehalococcoidia bacterium]
MHKHDVDTPALLLDLDVVKANIASMAAYFRDRPQKLLRPHFKTPKCTEIARRQLAAGAIGITVAKVGEAEVLARAGLGPILVANQAGTAEDRPPAGAAGECQRDRGRRERLQRARAGSAARAGRTPEVIIEVDTGMHRCGTGNPEETVELAQRIAGGHCATAASWAMRATRSSSPTRPSDGRGPQRRWSG